MKQRRDPLIRKKKSHVGRRYKTSHPVLPKRLYSSYRTATGLCPSTTSSFSVIAMQQSSRDMAGGPQADDFFDQMLSTLPSAWADLGAGGVKSPWEQLSAGAATEDHLSAEGPFGDESALLASRLQQHQIGGDKSSSPVMLQLSDLHRNGGGEESGGGFSPLPLFTDWSAPAREEMEGGFKSPNATVLLLAVFSNLISSC
jgi:hypothetical protein